MTMLAATVAVAQAQPKITPGGVVNSASYAATGLPNGAIAQGSLFVVFGTGLGPASLQQVSAYPLPASLGGTSLTVTVNGTSTTPFMIYTSAGQVAAILPSNTPVGTGTIRLTYNGAASATEPIRVAASSFGIYSSNQAGSGQGIITNTGYAVAGQTSAANPGEAYIIWGTGVGPITGDETGPGVGTKLGNIPVEVLVGGKTAGLIGYARASAASGLDQVAFTVPTGVTGCAVPVSVKIGNVISNYVTMPIAASGRTCVDANGITPITVTGNGTVSTGSIDLSRTSFSVSALGTTVTSLTDSGSASFLRYTAVGYSDAVNPLGISTFSSCTVFTFKGTTATAPTVTNLVNLDAGAALTVSGPGGTKSLPKLSGSYSATLGGGTSIPGIPSTNAPLYLSKGTYTVTGPGGTDVGPFTATLNIPDPLVWSNFADVNTVNRANGLPVTWTSGDPSGNVYIIGYSITGSANTSVGAEFVCIERNSAGRFTVPSAVLLSLPATSTDFTAGVGAGALIVEGSTAGSFKAPGLDLGGISSTSATFKTVSFQ